MYAEKAFEKEQLSILSSQLEMIVNNGTWSPSIKDGIIKTAKQLKNIINSDRKTEPEEVKRVIGILTKAKVKAVMSNDCDYYGMCLKLDSIISNLSKANGGVNE